MQLGQRLSSDVIHNTNRYITSGRNVMDGLCVVGRGLCGEVFSHFFPGGGSWHLPFEWTRSNGSVPKIHPPKKER